MPKKQSLVSDTYLQVIDYQASSTSMNYTTPFGLTATALTISNDSTSVSLTFQIGQLTMTLLAGERLSDARFDAFHAVAITATDAWRMWVQA